MGYTYKISLSNANGYIIDNVTTVEVNAEDLSHDVHVTKLELYNGEYYGIRCRDR